MALMMHWFASLLLIAMATFALLEAKSTSLIPKSLLLWPLMGFLFGALSLLSAAAHSGGSRTAALATGVFMLFCSVQALLVNIRKLTRWPSGAVWLGLVLLGLLYQLPVSGGPEPAFQNFFRQLSGFLWAAIGVTKVIGEKSVSQEGGIPGWILLLYVQAALVASSPR